MKLKQLIFQKKQMMQKNQEGKRRKRKRRNQNLNHGIVTEVVKIT